MKRGLCVALCSLKGGTGKTTLAYNLAERASACGLRPVLVDCDVQEAGMAIHQMGGDLISWPAVKGAVSESGLQRVVALAGNGEYDLVVCDLGGYDNMVLTRFLMEMDLVLSPVGGGPADLVAACGFHFGLQKLGVNLVFVPSGINPGRGRLVELREVLEERGARVSPVVVRRLVVHMDALRSGQGVCAYAPESPAALEVQCLWQWVKGELAGVAGGEEDGRWRCHGK